jgi:hypothetical protein
MKKSEDPVKYELSKITFEPFGNYPDRFAQYLSGLNYTEHTISQHLNSVGKLATLMEAEEIPIEHLDETLSQQARARSSGASRGCRMP